MLEAFPNLPLLSSAFVPIIILLAYGAVKYILGGAHAKEEAIAVMHRAVIAAVTVAMALLASVWVGCAVGEYLKASNATANCLSPLARAAPDLNLVDYGEAVKEALGCAKEEFQRKFDEVRNAYVAIFYITTGAGLFPITSPYSMGLFQVAMPFSGAASGALMALGVAIAAATVVSAFVPLMGLGAVLLAMERLETLGALILAVGMAFPAALAGAADAVSSLGPFSSGVQTAFDWGSLVAMTASAASITAYVVTALSLAGAGVAAVTYALTRIPQHLSVE